MDEAARVFEGTPRLAFVPNQAAALEGADALVLVTEWREFRNPDFEAMKTALRQPLIFDGRNQYDPALLKSLGFDYRCIGRPG